MISIGIIRNDGSQGSTLTVNPWSQASKNSLQKDFTPQQERKNNAYIFVYNL